MLWKTLCILHNLRIRYKHEIGVRPQDIDSVDYEGRPIRDEHNTRTRLARRGRPFDEYVSHQARVQNAGSDNALQLKLIEHLWRKKPDILARREAKRLARGGGRN